MGNPRNGLVFEKVRANQFRRLIVAQTFEFTAHLCDQAFPGWASASAFFLADNVGQRIAEGAIGGHTMPVFVGVLRLARTNGLPICDPNVTYVRP
jgi:hypothetical protein